MFRVRLVCKLVCGKGLRKTQKPCFCRVGRQSCIFCYAAAPLLLLLRRKVGEEHISPPGRDGRVAFFAALLLLCGGGLEGAPAAPLLLRRGGQSYSAPCCLSEGSKFTHFPTLRLLSAAGFGHLRALAAAVGLAASTPWTHGSNWGPSILHLLHAAIHMRAAAAGGLTPTTRWTPAGA